MQFIYPTQKDCQHCGACCLSNYGAASYVCLTKGDVKRLQKYSLPLVMEDGSPHLSTTPYDPRGLDVYYRNPRVCSAFGGRLGHQCGCTVYPDRPRHCREFKPGSPECLGARREAGLTDYVLVIPGPGEGPEIAARLRELVVFKGPTTGAAAVSDGSGPTVSVRLPLDHIRVDPWVHARHQIPPEVVDRYAAALAQGESFPRLVGYFDGTDCWLADGHIRAAAAKKVGKQTVGCDVRRGRRRDALLFAARADVAHGLARTELDKCLAVTHLLLDEEWARWSDDQIARHCGVIPSVVTCMRWEIDRRSSPVGRGIGTQQTGPAGIGTHGPQDPPADEKAARPQTRDEPPSFSCESCEEQTERAVWHCQGCGRHVPAEEGMCDRCWSHRPADCRSWVVVGSKVYPTPFAGLFPDLRGKAYDSFRDSVREHGLRDPVWVDERGTVIDGRQRLRVAAELGLEPKTCVRPGLSDAEKLGVCMSLNMHRASLASGRRGGRKR